MWLWRIFHGIALTSAPSLVAAYNFSGILLGVWVQSTFLLYPRRSKEIYDSSLTANWKMVAAVTINEILS